MFMCILNGIFTEDYFLDSVKYIMASHVLDKNNLGTRNKVKVELHKFFHGINVYNHTVICDNTNNLDENKLQVLLSIKPTIISPTTCYRIEMPLQNWPDHYADFFKTDQIIDLYTQSSFVCERTTF